MGEVRYFGVLGAIVDVGVGGGAGRLFGVFGAVVGVGVSVASALALSGHRNFRGCDDVVSVEAFRKRGKRAFIGPSVSQLMLASCGSVLTPKIFNCLTLGVLKENH